MKNMTISEKIDYYSERRNTVMKDYLKACDSGRKATIELLFSELMGLRSIIDGYVKALFEDTHGSVAHYRTNDCGISTYCELCADIKHDQIVEYWEGGDQGDIMTCARCGYEHTVH